MVKLSIISCQCDGCKLMPIYENVGILLTVDPLPADDAVGCWLLTTVVVLLTAVDLIPTSHFKSVYVSIDD